MLGDGGSGVMILSEKRGNWSSYNSLRTSYRNMPMRVLDYDDCFDHLDRLKEGTRGTEKNIDQKRLLVH